MADISTTRHGCGTWAAGCRRRPTPRGVQSSRSGWSGYVWASAGPSTAARIRQAPLAARLSLTYSHSQLLEAYLQSLFYGNGAYGQQAAAQIYLGADASKVDLAQAALLAGLTDQPTPLNPFLNVSGAKQRQH